MKRRKIASQSVFDVSLVTAIKCAVAYSANGHVSVLQLRIRVVPRLGVLIVIRRQDFIFLYKLYAIKNFMKGKKYEQQRIAKNIFAVRI